MSNLFWIAVACAAGWGYFYGPSSVKPTAVGAGVAPNRPAPRDANSEWAKEFHSRYINAEIVTGRQKALNQLDSVRVVVSVSENLCRDYEASLKTNLELKLRKIGVKVDENALTSVQLEINGFWDDSSITATFSVKLSVHEIVHVIRGNKGQYHASMISKTWESGNIASAGKLSFPQFLSETLSNLENELLNDYLAANP